MARAPAATRAEDSRAEARKDVAGVRKVVLQGTGKVGMTGARGCDGLVLGGITLFHGQNFFPVLPVPVSDGHGDGRTDGFAVTDAGKDVRGVSFNAHAAAAPKTLLTPPKFTRQEGAIDRNTGWQAT